MTQFNSVNVKLSDLQLEISKAATKNWTGVSFTLSINMIGNDKVNFPHKLFLIDRQLQIFVNPLKMILQLM